MLGAAAAFAFDPSTDHTCVYNCGGGSASPSSAPSSVHSGPSREQIEAQRRRRVEAHQRRALEERDAQRREFEALRDAGASELRGGSSVSSAKGIHQSDASELKAPPPRGKSKPKSQAKAGAASGPVIHHSPVPSDCIRSVQHKQDDGWFYQCYPDPGKGSPYCIDDAAGGGWHFSPCLTSSSESRTP